MMKWTYFCDGPGCDLSQQTAGGRPSDVIHDRAVSVGHVQIWRGHLCSDCEKKVTTLVKDMLRRVS